MNRDIQLIIPMSGVGRRFIEAGYTEPKPLIVVDKKPIIEHIISNFKDCGIKHYYISINYRKDLLIQYFKKREDIKLNFIIEIDIFKSQKSKICGLKCWNFGTISGF